MHTVPVCGPGAWAGRELAEIHAALQRARAGVVVAGTAFKMLPQAQQARR